MAVGRNSRALFRVCRSTNTSRSPESRSLARFSGSIPMHLCRPWTPALGPALAATTRRTASLATLAATPCAVPIFAWSDFYLTKSFSLSEGVKLRFDTQFFNVFNHPNFALPSMVLAGVPGKPTTQTGFGALTYTTSPPTGLLGVGLGGDSTPRMVAFQLRLDF